MAPGAVLGAMVLFGLQAAAAPLVDAEPSRVLLGTTREVRISVRGDGGALHGVASAGTLTPASSTDGTARFVWTPPDVRAPFVALLAFWETGPLGLRSVTTLTLPCSGRTELAIDTEPGARVTVAIAGANFGPRRADPRGKLRMPVEVPPMAHEARITAEVREQSKVRVVPLPGTRNPWVWVVEPAPLALQGETRAMLLAPEPLDSRLEVRASGARLERENAEPDRVLYLLVPLGTPSHVTLEASVPGEDSPRAVADVLGPPPEVPAPPPPPFPTGRRFEVGVALGAFVGGGNDVGPALTATVSLAPWRPPIFLELELGLRGAWFTSSVPDLGSVSTALVVFPIELAVRGTIWNSGRWTVDLRAGGGLLLGTNWISTSFGQASSEAATGWEVFGAAQVLYQAGPVQPYFEIRGAYALVTGTGLTAHPGGLVLLVGFHWPWSLK